MKYLNLIQIAESFGVSESVIEDWVRNEGMPQTPDRGRMLFDRAQVVEWAASRGLAARAGFLTPEAAEFATDCRLTPLLRAGGIWRDVAAAEVPDVLDKVVAALPATTPPIRQLLRVRLRTAGGITWAPIGGGMALPHLAVRVALGRDSGTVALLLLRDALPQADSTPDTRPVTRLFFFIAPSPRAHLDLLGRLTRALTHGNLRHLVSNGAPDADILDAASAADGMILAANKSEAG